MALLVLEKSEINDSIILMDKGIKNTMAQKSDLDLINVKLIQLMAKSKNCKR